MTGAYIDKEYVYAVARIRGAELKLLNQPVMDSLISAKSSKEAEQILREKGWGADSEATTEEMLEAEQKKLWELVDELVPDTSIFNVFRLSNDYNNLKAAIKESVMEYEYPGIYISESVIDPAVTKKAIDERNYSLLPHHMAEAAAKAHEVYLHTNDGQLCDIMVDSACLEAISAAGTKSDNEFLDMYAELTVAAANIKTAVRSALTGKDRDFLDTALTECRTLDKNSLASAALNGVDAICSYLAATDYADAISELRNSPAAFERWCDNLIIRMMRGELYNSFGLGPIAAYILARQNEIKSVRIILSGKQNGFPEEVIRERVRETYV